MAVEVGWQRDPGGIAEVWLMDHGQWVCKLFGQRAEAISDWLVDGPRR